VDAMINLYNIVTSCFESGDMALVSFLNLSKAFDCVFHSILAKKLPSYNLHPNSCKQLKSYLAGRYQVVTFKNKTSDCLPVNKGVPRGSTLGPLSTTFRNIYKRLTTITEIGQWVIRRRYNCKKLSNDLRVDKYQ
jgi:hypothetical protein